MVVLGLCADRRATDGLCVEVRWSDDVYFKSATTDRSLSAGRGYSNNDPIGNTDDKEITTAYQRAGNISHFH